MFVTDELVKRACAAYDAYEDEESTDYPCEYPAMWHALTAALASMWRPMDSAPKDGTQVLLWLGEPWSVVKAASWFEPWNVWTTDDPDEIDPRNDEFYGIGSLVPKGWMPLPAPPAAVGGE